MSMSINLLPIERKKSIKTDIFNRFLLKIGIIAIFAIFLFIIFLLANLFIISIYQKINQEEISRAEGGSLNGIGQEVKAEIDSNYSETTQSVKEINQRTSYWDYLNQINKLLPENVYYTQITIEAGTIKLKGLAKKRDDLVTFKELLSKAEIFQEVEMPISNFTSQTDTDFEIVLNLNKK